MVVAIVFRQVNYGAQCIATDLVEQSPILRVALMKAEVEEDVGVSGFCSLQIRLMPKQHEGTH